MVSVNELLHKSWIPIFASTIAIFGAKIILINTLGSEIPFWDQWDSEADFLYKPYLSGTLSWLDIFALHNEHRIVLTRILGILLLELSGVWSPVVETTANAALHVLGIGVFLTWLTRNQSHFHRCIVCMITAILFLVPSGWENTLAGFQSQYYFNFGLSIASIWAFTSGRGLSVRWLLGLLLAGASFLSLASGALAFLAGGALYCLQILCRQRPRDVREFAAVLIMFAVGIILVSTTPDLPYHEFLKATNFDEFQDALLNLASWPLSSRFMLLLYLPIPLLIIRVVRSSDTACEADWTVVALSTAIGIQWLAIAYGRAHQPIASRYLDTIIPMIPVAYSAAVRLFHLPILGRVARAWALVVLPVLGLWGMVRETPLALQEAVERGKAYRVQTENVKRFVMTGDPAHLRGKAYLDIPYPDPARLAGLLSDPVIRSVLHPAVTGSPFPPDPRPALILPDFVTRIFRGLVIVTRLAAPTILGVGLLIFAGLLKSMTDGLGQRTRVMLARLFRSDRDWLWEATLDRRGPKDPIGSSFSE